jgi:2-polyprenyl-6-methoxyphenol hydroxylase-like FAD-dependent oxidoreductase
MAYGTRVLRRRPDDFDGAFAVVVGDQTNGHRMGVLLPMEGDRWTLTAGGFHGDVPPTDDDAYRDFVASLPSSLLVDVLDRAEVLSPVMSHRLATSQRRHFEELPRPPAGFVALGDAICSFNPIYGQGMSSAALQADALDRTLSRQPIGSAGMAKAFYRAAAKDVDNPWMIAAGTDFSHPETTGPKPPGTAMVNRYLRRVQLATHVSPVVQRQMMQVQNLLVPPLSSMRPAMILRVLSASRRSPVSLGTVGPEPMLGRVFMPSN